MAADTGAELSIRTVLLLPLIAGTLDVTACTLVVASVMAQSAGVLAQAAAAAEHAGVSYTTHVRWGNLADVLLRPAEEADGDLIIGGSHACSWRSRRVLRHVIKQLPSSASPPLLVSTAPPEEAYRWRSWARLLVVHDGSPGGEAAVHHALALAQDAALDVCMLHSQPLRQPYETAPHRGTGSVQDTLPLVAAQTAMAGVRSNGVLALGHTVTAILETAADRACDGIILGVEQPSGWKRLLYEHTAKAVMAHTTLPVLLVNRLATTVTH